MIINVGVAELAEAIKFAGKVCEAECVGNIPVDHVYLRAAGSAVEVLAKNMTVFVALEVGAEVLEKGEALLPHKKFKDILKTLQGTKVEIRVKESPERKKSRVTIECGEFKFMLLSGQCGDFPAFPDAQGKGVLLLKEADLCGILGRTVVAVDRRNELSPLSGVGIKIHAGVFVASGCDRKRLSHTKWQIAQATPDEWKGIMPTEAVELMLAAMDESGERLAGIRFGSKGAELKAGKVRIYTRLMEGEYPEVERVIPKIPGGHAVEHVEVSALCNAVEAAGIASGEERAVTLSLTKNDITVTAENGNASSSCCSVAVKYEGPEISVLLDYRYILDALKSGVGSEINLWVKKDITTILIPGNDMYAHCIMSMRKEGNMAE